MSYWGTHNQADAVKKSLDKTKRDLKDWYTSAFYGEDRRIIKDIHDRVPYLGLKKRALSRRVLLWWGIIMADFRKLRFIIYDNDVIRNKLAGINMAFFFRKSAKLSPPF